MTTIFYSVIEHYYQNGKPQQRIIYANIFLYQAKKHKKDFTENVRKILKEAKQKGNLESYQHFYDKKFTIQKQKS